MFTAGRTHWRNNLSLVCVGWYRKQTLNFCFRENPMTIWEVQPEIASDRHYWIVMLLLYL